MRGPGRLSAVIVATALLLTGSMAAARSPSPSSAPFASPVPAASPAATPFPWPTVPSWYEVPVGAPVEPDGPPDASRTARGVRIELWFSTPDVAPGTWVQALVRATNTRTDDVWYWPGGCTAGTLVRVDLSSVTPMGVDQTGKAAVLKDIAITDSGMLSQTFEDYDDVVADQSSGARARRLAECVTPGNVRRLRPGATRMERFAWYAASLRAGRAQPLPPGRVDVSVLWPYAGHGQRPRVDWTHQPRHDLTASAPLVLTGDGPGTPSMSEMVDTALADPRFRAWVDPDPAPTDNDVTLHSWAYATIASPARWATMRDRAPNGFVEVSLGRDQAIDGHHLGAALLDAWTGELLDVVFEGELTTRAEAGDDRFRLTIETDAQQVTTRDAIDIRTTWAYLGTEPVRICTGGGGPVIFVVEQLDGFFDPGGGGDDSGRSTTVQPGTVEDVPFQKSGGYDASDPMAPQYAAWFDDPVLHLPEGVFRITADAEYGVGDCGAGTTLDASVVIAVTEAPGATPSPGAPPIAVWTPIDLDLIPWDFRCFQRFDPSALSLPGGIATDDADLAAMVLIHGPDAHLLMVDDRVALIGEVADGRSRARDPLYQYQLERWDGDGAWVWSAEGDCRPMAELTDPPAVGGHWRLDPAFPAPTAGSRLIHALVVARGCPSAVRLRGTPQVVIAEDAVGVVVPIVNRSNSDSCSPGTPTPVTIRLPEPLGDRTLYDAGVLPMREVRSR